MSVALYLSRARLRTGRGEALSSIAPMLLKGDTNAQAGHAHRLVWLLFQDIPDATRDFLWRDEGAGKYMILSNRPPSDPNGLFDLETKPFEPDLEAGQRLAFSMRVNPTKARKETPVPGMPAKRERGKRVDIVMDALKGIDRKQRALKRDEIAHSAVRSWLTEQGTKAGFAPSEKLLVESCSQVGVERKRGRPAGFSVLDIRGELTITDPALFLAKLPKGFGSAKAFGNGLMLIRRA